MNTPRLLLTIGSLVAGLPAALGALGTVPKFAPWAVPLASLASLFVGWAHLSRPGDGAQIQDAKAALAKVLEGEK